MPRRLPAVSEHATTVVRLFPDHADSVVWFSGPVPYEQTGLDAALVDDLRAWDASYYAGLDADYAWRAPALEAQFLAAGARLARRLADEVGDGFRVQHDVDGGRRRVRASGPARNPRAEAAFRSLADEARAEWARLAGVVAQAGRDGHTLEWRASP